LNICLFFVFQHPPAKWGTNPSPSAPPNVETVGASYEPFRQGSVVARGLNSECSICLDKTVSLDYLFLSLNGVFRFAWLCAVTVQYGFDSQYGWYLLKFTVALLAQCVCTYSQYCHVIMIKIIMVSLTTFLRACPASSVCRMFRFAYLGLLKILYTNVETYLK
jgi:hypothetical protein